MPFGRAQLTDDGSDSFAMTSHITGSVSAGRYRLAFDRAADEHDAFSRMIAYFLISAMPSQGLEESINTLRDVYLFHEESARLSLPTPSEQRAGLGTVSAITDRAPFVIGP